MQRISHEKGNVIHQILYDDGATLWHNLKAEEWRKEHTGNTKAHEIARARALVGQLCSVRLERKRRNALRAQQQADLSVARMHAIIWESERGIWLSSSMDE